MVAITLSGFLLATVAPLVASRSVVLLRWASTSLPAFAFIYFSSFLPTIAGGGTVSRTSDWVPSLGISLSFHLDGLSLLFVLLISGVGTLVFAYAGAYLDGSKLGRFYAWMLTFLSSMMGLVLADDFVVLFVFWELTSFASYMLIGFDTERTAARSAALQSLLVTAAGGLALLAGLLLLRAAAGVDRISALAGTAMEAHPLFAPILLLLLAGALTKSAQFPFHFWLPAAMEAPAPVSAYLHSATMVKAGVYLLARISPVFSESDLWAFGVTGVGAVTMLLGAFLALAQKDMKLALAHSTVSALGLLVMLLGLGTPASVTAAALFLPAHALYKGALFLAAGTVDHETGTRDLTRLGGLRRAMPLTAAAAALSALSMAGVPPLAGYLGKEYVIEAVLEQGVWPVLLTGGTLLTGALFFCVALNLGFRPFWGRAAATPRPAHEGPWLLWSTPMILALLGLVLGLASPLAAPLVAAASATVAGTPEALELGLWHGWTPAVALSGLVLAAGLLLFAAQSRLLPAVEPAARWIEAAPEDAYRLTLAGLNRIASVETGLLQSGYLRRYLLTVVSAMAVLVSVPMAGLLPVPFSWEPEAQLHEIAVATLIVAGAGAAVLTSSALTAVAGLGVAGYGVALVYFLFGAPDLALTQFVVETLTVILFVLALYHLPPFSGFSSPMARRRDVVVAAAVGVVIAAVAALSMEGALDLSLPQYYAENSLTLAHGRNIVNVILVDFRALDTLGEITVLTAAAVGVYALLRARTGRAQP